MFVTALYLLATASAAEEEARHSLNVTGVGEIFVAPDEAVLSLGVRAQADTAAAAFDKAAETLGAITDSLGQLVQPERVRTSQLSLQPRYEYDEKTGPRLVGYEATAILEIRVDEPDNAGQVLDAAVNAGANEVLGVNWKVEDEDAAQQQALDAAVEDARANATLVANELGVELGEPMTVMIRMQETAQPYPVYMERAAADADVAAMPVLSGEQIYRADVDVTFALDGEARPIETPEEPPSEEEAPDEEPAT
jgi:uncharacterized protein YggE